MVTRSLQLPEFGAPLKSLMADRRLSAAHGVYRGSSELKDGSVRIWPLHQFLQRLAAGDIIG